MMSYIDFHVHIDFYDDPDKIIKYYEDMGIYALFVTDLPEIFEKHLYKYANYKYVRLALGYHPDMISYYDFNKEKFNKYINLTNYIGEIGLDFTSNNEIYRVKQLQIFEHICSSIKDSPKILSVHSKKSENQVFQILKENQIKFAVFHWYSGNVKLIKEIIDQGYYFSVNYGMLKSKNGRKILSNIPLNRVLFETDGPFVKKDKKIIMPDNIEYIYNEFNKFYGIVYFQDIVYSNFHNLLVHRKNEEEENKINREILSIL